MFSTINAFCRQTQIGILQLLNERVKQYHDIEVKILIPTGERITETIKKAELDSQHVDFRIYEHGLEGMGFFLVDKKESLVIETKDDTKGDSHIAGGSSIYSNIKSIVNSYASIIESYWKQTVLYDCSKDRATCCKR